MLRTDQIMKWIRGPKVLDVGCTGHEVEIGSPYWLHGRLRQRFPDIVGIDSSSLNVLALQGKGFRNVYVQNAEEFSLPKKFDTIVAGELIEHLSNPGMFLRCAREHLADGGRVVLTTPYPFSLLYTLYALFKFPKTCQNPEHTCWLCPQTLKTLAERYGYKVVHFDLIEDYRPEDPSRRYRTFVRLITLLRPLIPKRLRNNTMLLVLMLDENSSGS